VDFDLICHDSHHRLSTAQQAIDSDNYDSNKSVKSLKTVSQEKEAL
jgi:hypothetical protein